MAICGEDRNSWYWKLPMALLSIRTTLKPDIGASPAELVYGEGLAIPGTLLPKFPDDEAETDRQQQGALASLRLEVERLQPTQTSSHRMPNVHIPEELRNATHVMIRRGGVNPPLTAPYQGPFRIEEKTQTGVKVHLPGRGLEEVALARVKPAYAENADNDQNFDDLEDEIPRSPPPPGRRPGPRTRQPEPTSRVTRQQARQDVTQPDPLAYDPGEGTSAQARESNPDSEDEYLGRLRRLRTSAADDSLAESDDPATPSSSNPADVTPPRSNPSDRDDPDPFDGHVPQAKKLSPCPCDEPAAPCNSEPTRFFTKEGERKFSKQRNPQPRPGAPSNPPPSRTTQALSFSNPKPGNFSYRRRKPDVNAFFNIVHDHLNS